MADNNKKELSDKELFINILERYSGKKLPLSRAFRIIDNIDLVTYSELTDKQLIVIGEAIKTLLNAPTIMSVNKEQLRQTIRFLWEFVFEEN